MKESIAVLMEIAPKDISAKAELGIINYFDGKVQRGILLVYLAAQKRNEKAKHFLEMYRAVGEPEFERERWLKLNEYVIQQYNYKDFAELWERAERNERVAMYHLGKVFYYGIENIIDKDYEFAMELLEKSTELGDVLANYELGLGYFWGCGVARNYSKAYNLLKKYCEYHDIQLEELSSCVGGKSQAIVVYRLYEFLEQRGREICDKNAKKICVLAAEYMNQEREYASEQEKHVILMNQICAYERALAYGEKEIKSRLSDLYLEYVVKYVYEDESFAMELLKRSAELGNSNAKKILKEEKRNYRNVKLKGFLADFLDGFVDNMARKYEDIRPELKKEFEQLHMEYESLKEKDDKESKERSAEILNSVNDTI